VNTTDELYEKVTSLDKDISSVLKDQDIQNRAMLKMEVTIDKLQTLAEAMHRLISIHDERINNNARIAEGHIVQSETQRDEMSRDIKDLNTRLTQDTNTLSQKMDSMENRLSIKIDTLTKRLDAKESKDIEDKRHEKAEVFKLKKVVNKWQLIILGIVFALGLIGGEHNIVASILKFFV